MTPGLAADDHRVLAAHLADDRAGVGAGSLVVELHAHLVRAREGDAVDAGVLNEQPADLVATDDDVERVRR
jgi:hypothetical protein